MFSKKHKARRSGSVSGLNTQAWSRTKISFSSCGNNVVSTSGKHSKRDCYSGDYESLHDYECGFTCSFYGSNNR
jgi:hypothetical protein